MTILEPDKTTFLTAHEKAILAIKADYEVTKRTRIEVGAKVPTYEEWLESEVELHKALVMFYRGLDKP